MVPTRLPKSSSSTRFSVGLGRGLLLSSLGSEVSPLGGGIGLRLGNHFRRDRNRLA